jgi:hypothetical protein
MAVKGWLPDSTMPTTIKLGRGLVKSFTNVHKTFVSKASTLAQAGNDYDIPNEPAAYDQGDLGSCVLNATTGAMNILLAVEGKPTSMLARLFLYWLCREVMGTLDQDSGTYTHLAVERAGNIGCCLENLWPYLDSNMYVPPGPDTYPEASDNKASAWFSIDAAGSARLDQLEAAIRSNHPVIYGSPVSSAIQQYQAGQILGIPNSNDIIGGHSTVFTGVRYIDGQRVWRIRNSWSTGYGDNGHFLIDDSWAAWPDLDDLWVLTRMDPLLF